MSARLLMLLLAGAADGGADAPRAAPGVLGALKGFTRAAGHDGATACAGCHSTASWTEVRFNHDRTGFALTGRHQRTRCTSCHVTDFKVPVPRGCVGCHRDVHGGELGARCEGCHDAADWRSRFDVDAHRRTNFPLMGAHAALPCVECHAEARERRFSRSATDCQACHQADAERTAVASAVNHVALNLVAQPCRQCHGPLAFRPASFPAHDACFPISAGAHAGIACLDCHATLAASAGGERCSTRTAACTKCHTNDGRRETGQTDAQHDNGRVPGYLWSDARCVGCHAPGGR
jgi:hypothetical protein